MWMIENSYILDMQERLLKQIDTSIENRAKDNRQWDLNTNYKSGISCNWVEL